MDTKVVPKRVKEWDVDQCRHQHLPTVPFRMIVAGPSGVGKTQLIQAMILDFYKTKGGRQRLRPHLHLLALSARRPGVGARAQVLREGAGQDQKDEPFLFDHYNPAELQEVMETQKRVIAAGKEQEGTQEAVVHLDRGR